MEKNNQRLKATLILAIVQLFFMPLISASLGTYKQGECVEIKTVLNASWVNISTINYPNLSRVIENKAMTKIGQTFYYTYCHTNYSGKYIYDYYDSNGDVYVNDFYISPNGDENTTSKAIFYLISMGILIVFFSICVIIFLKVDNLLTRVAMIGIGYILLLTITFTGWQIAQDFLISTSFITDILRILFFVLIAGALPLLIGAFAYYFLAVFKIKEIQNLMEKGMPMDEAERRVNRRRR